MKLLPTFGKSLVYKVEISLSAKRDISETAKIIQEREKNPLVAGRWITDLYQEIKKLTELPHRFAIIPEAEDIGVSFRSMRYQSHRIIYEVDDKSSTVTVVRVYHRSRRSLRREDFGTHEVI